MLSHRELGLNDSRTIAPDENCPFPNPKLTLSQPLTLAGEQLCSGALVWLSLNPKANPNIDPNPNPIGEGAIFLGGEGGENCQDTSLHKITVLFFINNRLRYNKKTDN